MEKETPYWESKTNNNNSNFNNNLISIHLAKFIGKSCYISFEKGVYIPYLDKYAVGHMKATILGYDSLYLLVEFTLKKKYTTILKLSNINGITIEEN